MDTQNDETIKDHVWRRLIAKATELKHVMAHIELVHGDPARYQALYESGALRDYTAPPSDALRGAVEAMLASILEQDRIDLDETARRQLVADVLADAVDFGPLEPYLPDPDVTAVLVDGYDRIYVEREGRLEDVDATFRDEAHLVQIIHRVLAPTGVKIDDQHPVADVRLPDGARAIAALPPVALTGPTLVISKFPGGRLTVEDLLRFGAWDADIVAFLRACVQARLNIAIAGGWSAGKTTVLNIVAGMIPEDERIIAIQNATELHLPQRRAVRLESRPPDHEGKGGVATRDLVISALKMRPDRIIIGEVSGAEVMELFQAINIGGDGVLFGVSASGVRDALARLEVMGQMHNLSLPLLAVRQHIASAIDLIMYQERLIDGTRKIMRITEVAGMQGDAIVLEDIFQFQQTGFEAGKVTGHFTATGYVPQFVDRMQKKGLVLPENLFAPK